MKRGFHTGLLFLITAVFIFFPFSSGCSGGDTITGLPSAGGENTAVVSSIITGTVYDEGGQPLPNISVKLKSISNSVEMTAAADNKGSFTFTVSKGGNYYIEAERGDGKVYYSYEFSVKLGENQDVTVGYGPGPQGPTGPTGPPGPTGPAGATGATGTTARGILRVNVQNGGGTPIAYSRVKLERYGLTGSEEEIISSDSSGNGWYQFDNLYPGQYLLEVEAAGYVTYSQDITVGVGSQTVTATLTAKVWLLNVRVDDAPGITNADAPDIALDNFGNSYAVWCDDRNIANNIFFSYCPPGEAWQPNVRVDDSSAAALGPGIAVDSSGNAYVVWCDNRNGNYDIYSSFCYAGIWDVNRRIDDAPGNTLAQNPVVAIDRAGNAYVVWEDERNGDFDIYSSYCPYSGNWQPNVRVDDASGGVYVWGPSIAVDSSGNAYVVWSDMRNGDGDIYFSYRPSGGIWQSNIRIDDASGGTYAGYPDITVDSYGNAYTAWVDERNGNYDIYFSYSPSNGAWLPNIKIDDAPGASGVWDVNLQADFSSDIYAIWDDDRNGNSDIYFSTMVNNI